jgi:FixJ family two-component response regulator
VIERQSATILVIDDDEAVREALNSLLRSVGFATEIYGSIQDYLARGGRPPPPCCLVLDVRLPGASGLDFQADLARRNAFMPIVFITGHGNIPMSVQAMKAGAIEFLTKPFRDQDLLDAIHQGLELDRRRSEDFTLVEDLRRRFDTLSAREQQVMAEVVSGKMNRQIGEELGIAEITVKVHRGQVMRKMAASSVVELARMADKLALAQGDAGHTPTRAAAP